MVNAVQLPFLVEAVLILAAAAFGFWLRRKGKPYGAWKITFHLFFYVWLTTGYGFIATTLFEAGVSPFLWTAVLLMGIFLTVQLATGAVMWARRQRIAFVPRLHLTSASLVLLTSLGAFLLAA